MSAAPLPPEPGPDLEAEAGARVLGGRYVLLELLSHGELGGVHLGRDRVQNRSVEVKLLSATAAASAPVVAQLRSRARRMFGIRHPHVASVYDEALDEDGLPFFVTEHVEGRNLHHMQGDPRLTGAAVQAIAHQLAQGLAALHSRSVVHGAVTPGNVVWLDDEAQPDHVKLVDRELSPGDGDALGMQAAQGYRPPGARTPDEAGDLYGLGVVVYELCTGRLPWADPDLPPRMRGEDLPIAVSEAFEAIVLDLVSHDPAARSAGAPALIDRLVQAGAVPLPAPRPPPARHDPPEDELEFADHWVEPDNSELTRFRPVQDGPPTPATSDLPPEPPELAAAEFFAQASAPATRPRSGPSPASAAPPPAPPPAPNLAPPVPVASASESLELTPTPAGATAALEARRAAQRAARARQEASLRTWRLVGGLIVAALLLLLIWRLSTEPASPPTDPPAPAETPAATAQRQPEPLPAAVTLDRTVDPSTPARTDDPTLARTDPVRTADTTLARTDPTLARTADPPPREPADDPAPDPARTGLPEQLSAAEFRRLMLRANRLVSTRDCYRTHTTTPDRSLEMVAIVGPAGRVQKLRADPGPLADCLRKVVRGLDFPAAQKSAQHIFVFHNPDALDASR